MASPIIFIAMLGGVLPALLWLTFWLMEDRCEPEPKRYLLLTFIAGGVVVFAALWIEQQTMRYFTGTTLLFLWAVTEEMLKFGAAYLVALRLRIFDEPNCRCVNYWAW